MEQHESPTIDSVVFLVADPSSIGATSDEFDGVVQHLEDAAAAAAAAAATGGARGGSSGRGGREETAGWRHRCIRVDFDVDAAGDPLVTLLAAYKEHSLPSGMNVIVAQGYGAILALRLARTFTRHALAGLCLAACPTTPAPDQGRTSVLRLAAWAPPRAPPRALAPPAAWWACAGRCLWRAALRRAVAARYGALANTADATMASAEPAAERPTLLPPPPTSALREGALRRADAMGPRAHARRVARCVAPFRLGELRNATLPTVLLYGACAAGEAAAAAAAQLAVPAHRLRVLPGAGHQAVEERPAAVAAEVVALLGDAHAQLKGLGLLGSRGGAAGGDGVGRSVGCDEVDDPDIFATF